MELVKQEGAALVSPKEAGKATFALQEVLPFHYGICESQ